MPRYSGFEDEDAVVHVQDWRNLTELDHMDAVMDGQYDFGRIESKDEVALMAALTAAGIVKESVIQEMDDDGKPVGEGEKHWEVRKTFRFDADVIDPATKVSEVKEIKLLPGIHLQLDENGNLKHFNLSFGR